MKKVILIAIFLVTACKSNVNNENSVDQSTSIQEAEKEFIVKMSFKTDQSGVMQMVLYNIKKDEFQNKYIVISEKIEPSSGVDSITANFQDNISDNFRINFGNKVAKEIEVVSIEISYGEQTLNINSENLATYFKFNEFIKQDSTTFKLRTTSVNNKLNPTMYLNASYLKDLNKTKAK